MFACQLNITYGNANNNRKELKNMEPRWDHLQSYKIEIIYLNLFYFQAFAFLQGNV